MNPYILHLYPIVKQFQEPLHLCGLSLGGILALHYATVNPDKVASLVLIGAQYKMPKKLLKVQNTVFHILPNSLFQKQGISKQDMISLTKIYDGFRLYNLFKKDCLSYSCCMWRKR